MVEYKVYIYKESIFSSLIFGSAKLDKDKLEKELNNYAQKGYKVKAMSREKHRTALFSSREAFVFILEKNI